MTLAHASSTASLSFSRSFSAKTDRRAESSTKSRIIARFTVSDGTESLNVCWACSTGDPSLRELADGLLLGLRQVVELMESKELEHVKDLRREVRDFDVASEVADLLDAAHEHAEAGARDVVQVLAVDDDSDASRVDRLLKLALELRGRVRVEE